MVHMYCIFLYLFFYLYFFISIGLNNFFRNPSCLLSFSMIATAHDIFGSSFFSLSSTFVTQHCNRFLFYHK